MQSSLYLPLPTLPPLAKPLSPPRRPFPRLFQSRKCSSINASELPANDNPVVDYSSMSSVFPAEACEVTGGEACNVEMYPEVKLKPEATATRFSTASEGIDREYLNYDSPKTVFPGEACDDLGGEFCDPDYQKGVY